MKKNDMNLLERYRLEQKRKSNQTSPIRVYFVILIATVFLVGAFSLKLLFDNISLENNIKITRDYIESPEVKKIVSLVDDIQLNLDRLDSIEEQALSLNQVLDYKPIFDSKILDIIYYEKPTAIKFTKISYELNTVILSISGTRPSDVSNFALRLQRTKSFADVSYSGYNYDIDTKLYESDIFCVLKGVE